MQSAHRETQCTPASVGGGTCASLACRSRRSPSNLALSACSSSIFACAEASGAAVGVRGGPEDSGTQLHRQWGLARRPCERTAGHGVTQQNANTASLEASRPAPVPPVPTHPSAAPSNPSFHTCIPQRSPKSGQTDAWGMQVWKLGVEGAALGCVGTGGTGAGLEASKEAILAFCCVTPCPAVRSHGLRAKPHCRCSCVPLSSGPPPHPHFPQPPAAPDASAQAKIEELQADNAKLEGDLRDLQAKLAQVPPPRSHSTFSSFWPLPDGGIQGSIFQYSRTAPLWAPPMRTYLLAFKLAWVG